MEKTILQYLPLLLSPFSPFTCLPSDSPVSEDVGIETPRDGILERHFQSRFLYIDSSLLRLEFLSGSTKCY